MDNKVVILGTPEAISLATTWSDFPVVAVAQCYSHDVTMHISGEEIEESKYYVESRPAMNPSTGTWYDFQDPTRWTTAFKKDELYDDISRFCLTQSAFMEFQSTFLGTSLSGNQLAVACIAFQLSELGYTPYVTILSSEHALSHFVSDRGWSYKIVDS